MKPGINLVKGCVTYYDNIHNKCLKEMENILGFHTGRLSKGAHFLQLIERPTEAQSFYFQNKGRNDVLFEDIPKDLRGHKQITKIWNEKGKILVKVVPIWEHDNECYYPKGIGIYQFNLTRKFQALHITTFYKENYDRGTPLIVPRLQSNN
jgi:hypothetical protein